MQQGRLCRSFQEFGQCSYGSRCWFIHAVDELQFQAQETAEESTNTSGRVSYNATSVSRVSVHQRLSLEAFVGSQGLPAPRGNSIPYYAQRKRGREWGQGRGGRGYKAASGGRPSGTGLENWQWLYSSKQEEKEKNCKTVAASQTNVQAQSDMFHLMHPNPLLFVPYARGHELIRIRESSSMEQPYDSNVHSFSDKTSVHRGG
jgi:hypothetical protein